MAIQQEKRAAGDSKASPLSRAAERALEEDGGQGLYGSGGSYGVGGGFEDPGETAPTVAHPPEGARRRERDSDAQAGHAARAEASAEPSALYGGFQAEPSLAASGTGGAPYDDDTLDDEDNRATIPFDAAHEALAAEKRRGSRVS